MFMLKSAATSATLQSNCRNGCERACTGLYMHADNSKKHEWVGHVKCRLLGDACTCDKHLVRVSDSGYTRRSGMHIPT
jgi:hypothetical protein